jgi:glycosyltransferase involved in cell wall biosynthesis
MKSVARLAWFSPMPPARTGVAVYSAEVVAALAAEHQIDVFVDDTAAVPGRRSPISPGTCSAHDFVWRNALEPYELTVFQLGNSSAHEYIWPYLFRFPGLVVLHDAHLHHARAAALLKAKRMADYRAEFAANEPDVSEDLAEVAVAGFATHLYYSWPMTRVVAMASKVTAVHSAVIGASLGAAVRGARIEHVRLGHGRRVGEEEAAAASERVRARHGIPRESVVFGVHGGLTPEKRIPQILSAFAALLPYVPSARLLLAGAPAPYSDLQADIRAHGIENSTVLTGYVDRDDEFTEYVAACDVSIALRWPSAREVQGPWVRALAAGRPTITTDLEHMADVPSLDPRTWATPQASTTAPPVTVSIDILDEDHSLRLALRRLAADADLRRRLGRAAAAYWEQHHSIEGTVDDYRRTIARALAAPAPAVDLPAHLRADGSARLVRLLEPFELTAHLWGKI